MMTYPMHVAGLVRDLPICKVTEDFYIGAFIMFGDAELTVACARDLLKLAEELDYDYLLTAEAKSIPLIHEMARQSGAVSEKQNAPDDPHDGRVDPEVIGDTGTDTADLLIIRGFVQSFLSHNIFSFLNIHL